MKPLKQIRREQALSIRELAKLAEVAVQTVVSAEAGKDVHLATIRRLSAALGVAPMDVAEFARVIGGEDAD